MSDAAALLTKLAGKLADKIEGSNTPENAVLSKVLTVIVDAIIAVVHEDPRATYERVKAQLKAMPVAAPSREQRIDWAYGNAKMSNPDVTREMAEQAVDEADRKATEKAVGDANAARCKYGSRSGFHDDNADGNCSPCDHRCLIRKA